MVGGPLSNERANAARPILVHRYHVFVAQYWPVRFDEGKEGRQVSK